MLAIKPWYTPCFLDFDHLVLISEIQLFIFTFFKIYLVNLLFKPLVSRFVQMFSTARGFIRTNVFLPSLFKRHFQGIAILHDKNLKVHFLINKSWKSVILTKITVSVYTSRFGIVDKRKGFCYLTTVFHQTFLKIKKDYLNKLLDVRTSNNTHFSLCSI